MTTDTVVSVIDQAADRIVERLSLQLPLTVAGRRAVKRTVIATLEGLTAVGVDRQVATLRSAAGTLRDIGAFGSLPTDHGRDWHNDLARILDEVADRQPAVGDRKSLPQVTV
jgi:hypothetical protein